MTHAIRRASQMNARGSAGMIAAWFAAGSLAVLGDVAAPVFDPGEGDAAATFPVTVTCATAGATIRYTLNGSDPTELDPVVTSGGTITIARNLTLKAKAWSGSETSPVTAAVYGLTGAVAAGGNHVLSLSSDGAIHAWGEQSAGRLGNGLTSGANVSTPGASKYSSVSEITDGTAVGAGLNHSVFLSGGAVWAFGANGDGQLGNNSTANSAYAVQVRKSTGATDYLTGCVSALGGNNFSAAVHEDGYVYTWGVKTGGRLGEGNITGIRAYAGRVERGDVAGHPDLDGIIAAALGGGFVLAREPHVLEQSGGQGRVWAWGHGGVGQLGSGATGNRKYAYPVLLDSTTELTDAWHVSAGESHSAVVRWKTGDSSLQGSVWTFGQRAGGRLGNNSTASGNVTYPVQVVKSGAVPLDHITMVAAGSAHTLALDDEGRVWAWGENAFGAVGDNTTTDRGYAVPVKNPDGSGQLGDPDDAGDPRKIVLIAAGGDGTNNTSFAIAEDGKVYGWGRNDDGELGGGSTSTGATPLPQVVPGFKVVPGFPDVALVHSVNHSQDPGNVTLTATPTDPDGLGNIDKVEFYSQGVLAGQTTASPWQLVLSNLTQGTYHVYAVVTDDEGNQGQSSPVAFTIHPSDPNSDLDGDGLTYSDELALGTDPQDPDTDSDRMGDGYEDYYGLDPLSPVNGGGLDLGPDEDKDGDGWTNRDESDRGRIPTSNVESPAVTGGYPAPVAKWWGTGGVVYHLEYSSMPDMSGATTHPVAFNGGNAEISVDLSTVVNPVPNPVYLRLTTESDAPEVVLLVNATDTVAPGQAVLSALPSDPDGSGDIAKVEFYSQDEYVGQRTASPWTLTLNNLAAGTYAVRAVVTDQGGKRGFSANGFTIDPPDPGVDGDADGLPDAWELEHFGHLGPAPGDDTDADGMSNLEEYQDGTDPNNPDSDGDGIADGDDNNPLSADRADFTAGSLLVISPLR